MTEKFQDQMPGLTSENEVLVRGHVRRVKPAGERKPRVKPYPSKWGRGKSYGFSDARLLMAWSTLPLRRRLALAYIILRGGSSKMDGPLVVVAAHNTRPVVKPASASLDGGVTDDFVLGPRDERP